METAQQIIKFSKPPKVDMQAASRQALALANKQEVIEFMNNHLHFNDGDNLCFFTLRFCTLQKDLQQARNNTRKIMAQIYEKTLGRRWYKDLPPTIAIIEHGKRNIYHMHLVANFGAKDINAVIEAITTVSDWCYKLNFTWDYREKPSKIRNENYTPVRNHLLLEPVSDLQGLLEYITKEYLFFKTKPDFSNFYTEQTLFNN
jgi:hypothetical protein